MNRKQLIETLIAYELEWLHSNFDKHNLTSTVEFFAEGGFENWTDKELLNKYDLFANEEIENA